MFRSVTLLRKILFFFSCLTYIGLTPCKAQNDLPNPSANNEVILAGSLVIPMDNSLQATPGYFNLMAYGLVNQLLQNNIPVKWAIKSGKTKDGIDFSGMAQRIRPSVQFPNWFDFRSGPFIVDAAYANAAKTLAATHFIPPRHLLPRLTFV